MTKERIRKLLKQIGAGLYERDYTLAVTLLAAVAGEAVFLLGMPGVGKSMIARRLKSAFRNAQAFEYLMSRFSTPDEIFGPVSISKLKNEDRYERVTEGYLPSADIVFLDEIWKAGPAIQNALLTVLNEKIFRNGDEDIRLPLKCVIAASNELPAESEGLEALWDRFLVRMVVLPLETAEAFHRMICGNTPTALSIDEKLTIDFREYVNWAGSIDSIAVGEDILRLIDKVRDALAAKPDANTDRQPARSLVSDRRWKKIVRLLRAAAFLEERPSVELCDCFLIGNALWNTNDERESRIDLVDKLVTAELAAPFRQQLNLYTAKHDEIRQIVIAHARKNRLTLSKYRVVDGKYYNITGCKEGRMLIPIEQYDRLSTNIASQAACVPVTASHETSGTLLTTQTGRVVYPRLSIAKAADGILINGTSYPLEPAPNDYLKKLHPEAFDWLATLDRLLERLYGQADDFQKRHVAGLSASLFINLRQIRLIKKEFSQIKQRITNLRNSIYRIE